MVGSFNPAIFSPAWFEVHEILGADQVADADVQLIMPNVAAFRVGWLNCQVDNTRLTLSTEDSQEFLTLRDAVMGVLTLLPHTPVSVMGLNRYFHVLYSDREAWHRVGDTLTPKEIWESVLTFPGMASVTLQGARGNKYPGSFNVTVQPSNVVRPGVFLQANDHFVLRVDDTQPKSRDDFVEMQISLAAEQPNEDRIAIALEVLNKEWTASMDRAYEALQRVLTL